MLFFCMVFSCSWSFVLGPLPQHAGMAAPAAEDEGGRLADGRAPPRLRPA
jgi:hypothetical protein